MNTCAIHDKDVPAVAPLTCPTVEGACACSACGQTVTVQLAIKDGIIVGAGGIVEGCDFSRESLIALLETVKGMSAYEAQAVSCEDIRPRLHRDIEPLGCDNWCVAALRIALRNYRLYFREAA